MLTKIITVICFTCSAAIAQDWMALFDGLVSTDSAVSESARQQLFELLPVLAAKSDEALNADIVRLLPVAEDVRETVRSQVSGLLVGLALNRANGLASLKAAIPLLIRWMQDSNQNVRMNAHLILANIRPSPPVEAIDAFAASLSSKEIRAAGSAAVALGRLSPTTPRATHLLTTSLATERVPERLVAIIYGIGEAKSVEPSLIEGVTGNLKHVDARVVFAALDCLGKLGPAASSAAPEIRKLAAQSATVGSLKGEIADAANAALSRIGK
jgi:hypothetical protein